MRKGGSYVVREIGEVERAGAATPAAPETKPEAKAAAGRPKPPVKAGRKSKEKH